MAPLRPVGGVMEATFIFNTLSCATVCLLAYMWHDPSHQLQWAGWYFQCTDSTWRLTNNKLWHVFTSCHINLKLSSSWMYFLFITFIVFVLFAGVFNSAEAWRQCHIGHDVEGKTAASMWDWHKHHHLQLHQQIVLIWRNKCILPRWLIYSLFHVFLFVCVTLVFQLHKQADMQEEKNRIERVLGAISAPDLIQKVLNFALSVHVYCTWSNVDVVPARDLSL